MRKLMRSMFFLALAAALAAAPAQAQDAYPSKPVRLIIPFAPGGPADLIARIIGQKLTEEFGRQFYIENHAGAGGNTGTALGARAPADGTTLIVNSQAIVINASLYKSLPYDPDKDLAPIIRIANTPNVVVVHPSVPAASMKELVALIKSGDARYHAYAHPGVGTPANLSGELFKLSQKLSLTAIPFTGGGPMIQSVVAGHTPIAFASMPPATSQIKAGTIRALAVTTDRRDPTMPDIPTMVEAGYPGQIGETPIGVLAPAGTPKETIDVLHRKLVQIIAQPDTRQRLAVIGFSPIGDTPAEFSAYLKAEHVKWAKVIREAGIAPQ
ncbi:MAG: tripartite tricarboxylate transporter substrate binding protein [Xanthobacteraceae bacterium]|nr:tripartite tricarboxylate transporter substrate binding protein [Xanthobacteraceae bacterium]